MAPRDNKGEPTVNENHWRAISTTLALLDEMLCEFEQWTAGREIHSVLYQERNSLSDEQRHAIDTEISAMRDLLCQLRDDLELQIRSHDAGTEIWSRGLSFWETLVGLEGGYLRAYGEPSPALVNYLEPKVVELVERLLRISDIARPTDARPDSAVERPRETRGRRRRKPIE